MFQGRTFVVTGATGLVGSHIVEELLKRRAKVRAIVHQRPSPFGAEVEHHQADLRHMDQCRAACRAADGVIHAAAYTAGPMLHRKEPVRLYTENMLINTHVLEAARLEGAKYYVFISNNSVYPSLNHPLKEEEAWDGQPDPQSLGFSWVKRMGELQAQIYAANTDMTIRISRGGNVYGPRDNFDLEYSHVLPALLRKALAKQNPFEVWGTGEEVRDFIHSRDMARGILMLLEKYPKCEPVNLATGRHITVKDLLRIIFDVCDHKGAHLKFLSDRPAGVKMKVIDTSKADAMGFKAQISLEEGLRETVVWFKSAIEKGWIK